MLPTPSHPMMMPGMAGQILVGSVVAYAGPLTSPDVLAYLASDGWLLCDGRSLLAADYPELFACFGYAYGGEGASFAIPDYRNVATGLPSVGYLIRYTRSQPQMRSPN